MPIIKPRIKYGCQQWDTYAEIDGYEHDSVTVHYYTSPAEPDVGSEGDLEIESVFLENQGDVMHLMTAGDIEQLTLRVNEHENERYEDSRY